MAQRNKGQGVRDNDRRQRTGGRRHGSGEMNERGQGYLSQRGDKGLLLDMAHRQMTVYEGKMKNPMRGRGIYFNWHVN